MIALVTYDFCYWHICMLCFTISIQENSMFKNSTYTNNIGRLYDEHLVYKINVNVHNVCLLYFQSPKGVRTE